MSKKHIIATILMVLVAILFISYKVVDGSSPDVAIDIKDETETKNKNTELENEEEDETEEVEEVEEDIEPKHEEDQDKQVSRGTAMRYKDLGSFTITAYDLSVQSCGKPMGHPNYGITASGYSLAGKSWEEAMTVAVDPKVIPLGSKLLIEFEDEAHQKYSGIYTARDTGGAIKGKKIDVFLGDFQDNNASSITMEFGVVKNVSVKLILE